MMSYSLGTDNRAIKALEIQQSIIGQDSIQHLILSGLHPGAKVWELGCGSGELTLQIAKVIDDKGKLVVFDMSKDQLDRVKTKIQKEFMQHIDYVCCDLEKYKFPKKRTNFICGRYILMHLQNPLLLLNNLSDALIDKGFVCFQEGCWQDTKVLGKYSRDFQDFINAVITLGQKLSVDYNIGSSVDNLLAKAKFNNIKCIKKNYLVPEKYIGEWWQIRLSELGPKFLSYDIVNKNTLDHWYKLSKIIDDTTIEVLLFYVSGKK